MLLKPHEIAFGIIGIIVGIVVGYLITVSVINVV